MSVFGGDSWGREAQNRKRRVEDLVVEGLDVSSYKKLSNGKYTCLVCSHHPIFDSTLMLSMHCKGSRHCAAESRQKGRELATQDEVNKRIALGDHSLAGSTNSGNCSKKFKSAGKPLIEQTKKAASERLCNQTSIHDSDNKTRDMKLRNSDFTVGTSHLNVSASNPDVGASHRAVAPQHLDYKERRERELKFTAAGWKRDCHGKWYKDENVEFDSDEEDPNICLS
ncbi:hypothetical protein UlMin_044012 [Ulmus minor]